jgi:hypothetical protein
MKKAFWILFILLMSNVASMYYGWYLNYWWFDIVQHLLGGFFVAMFMAFYLEDRLVAGDWIKNLLIIVGVTVFIGVVWEFAEYIANQTLIEPTYKWFGIRAYFIGDLNDTILDLAVDILGASLFSISHFLRRRETH